MTGMTMRGPAPGILPGLFRLRRMKARLLRLEQEHAAMLAALIADDGGVRYRHEYPDAARLADLMDEIAWLREGIAAAESPAAARRATAAEPKAIPPRAARGWVPARGA